MSDPEIRNAETVFDDWAARGRDEGMEEGHFPRAIQALKAIPLKPGDQVIDLGCGNGWATRWLEHMVDPNGKAHGIDVSQAMIEKAQSLSDTSSTLEFHRAAFESLPFETASLAHAFSMEALYYAEDLDIALREIARVIKPGGTLSVCTDFFTENPQCHHWPEFMKIPMALLSTEEWKQHLISAGFTEVTHFRCFDPRAPDPTLPAKEQESIRIFREEIGSLALRGVRAQS